MARLSSIAALLTLGLGLAATREARAAVDLCVEVSSSSADQAGFAQLVRSEIQRHPSHKVVESKCQSRLVVELFQANGSRYLTVRLDGEIPDRSTIASDADVAPKLSESITQVLGNDPMHLSEDPAKWSAMERASRSVLLRGANTFRVELFELMARTDHNVAFAPGVGVGFARGADHWQVAARLHLAGNPTGVSGDERALRLSTGMELGLIWEASRKAATSGYLGAGAGLSVLRFAGYLEPNDKRTITDVTALVPAVHLRAGVRCLRLFDFDADAFVQANVPVMPTKQVDDPMWGDGGRWTPMLQVGVGVGF